MNISDRSTRASWVFSYGVVDGCHRYAFLVASSAEFALAAVRSLFDHFIIKLFAFLPGAQVRYWFVCQYGCFALRKSERQSLFRPLMDDKKVTEMYFQSQSELRISLNIFLDLPRRNSQILWRGALLATIR